MADDSSLSIVTFKVLLNNIILKDIIGLSSTKSTLGCGVICSFSKYCNMFHLHGKGSNKHCKLDRQILNCTPARNGTQRIWYRKVEYGHDLHSFNFSVNQLSECKNYSPEYKNVTYFLWPLHTSEFRSDF